MPAENSQPPQEPMPVQPISYRSVQIGITEWSVLESFTSISKWHAAKAILDRKGVIARMASNPLDDNRTDLLVPRTDVLWAAELLRQANAPQIEQALGFPMTKPPPLPKAAGTAVADAGSDSTGAMQVLELDEPSASPEVIPGYGCILAALWGLLAIAVILLVMAFVTY